MLALALALARGTCGATCAKHTREPWLDDEDALARRRRAHERPGTSPRLAA